MISLFFPSSFDLIFHGTVHISFRVKFYFSVLVGQILTREISFSRTAALAKWFISLKCVQVL